MKILRSIAGVACIALTASCGSGTKPSSSTPAEAQVHKPLSKRLDEANGYQVDSNGNWVPKNNKRSSFESQGRAPQFSGEYGTKQYKAGEYARKSWWGNKDYGRQSYGGNTDGSRFQTSSQLQGRGAPEAGTGARLPDPYQAGTYATGAAREAGGSLIAKPGDDATNNRRESYVAPEIIDWREQRSLSISQSRGLLGR